MRGRDQSPHLRKGRQSVLPPLSGWSEATVRPLPRAQSSKFWRDKADTCPPLPVSFLPPNLTAHPIYSLHLPSRPGLCSYCSSPSPLTFFLWEVSPDSAVLPDRLEQTEWIALTTQNTISPRRSHTNGIAFSFKIWSSVHGSLSSQFVLSLLEKEQWPFSI